MRRWCELKFEDDLSDIRPREHNYYKHHVHHFVTTYFCPERIKGATILDLGCGPGFYSTILARHAARVVGIDRNATLIRKAREHRERHAIPNLEYVQADCADYLYNLEPDCFDYALAIDTVVSFDFNRRTHAHHRAVRTFQSVARVLKPTGRLFIIEAHPFFGTVMEEITSPDGEVFCIRQGDYRIEYKTPGELHHWFTLEEMTRAASEGGLAIIRIHEPEPSRSMQDSDPDGYRFRMRYPAMIVYEICRLMEIGSVPTNSDIPTKGDCNG